MSFRTEHDSLGAVLVPTDVYWGAQTQRAVDNFPISGRRMPAKFIHILGLVKRACAKTSDECGLLPVDQGEWIAAAAQEVFDGRWDEHFPVDVFQTGSGTSTNMNANEVIANRANELIGGEIGSNTPIHPNDHVNLCQSSNDVIPTTTHVAAAVAIQNDLLPALRTLHDTLAAKAVAFDRILKTGRTHLMDATPVRLGQEFAGYAAMVEQSSERALRARNALLELALGGTAVGTGMNRPIGFPARAITRIADVTGLPFRETRNHIAAQASPDGVVECTGQLRAVASALTKIADDLRWLASGPSAGIGEIHLPALQPGSSIMPGKVNPVLCEMLVMACAQVVGNDAAITTAARSGAFELHTAWPLLADRLLDSIHILSQAATVFAERCVTGITADVDACTRGLEHNLVVVTALVPVIGYEQAAAIAKEAVATGKTIREVASVSFDAETLNRLLDFWPMTEPGGTGSGGVTEVTSTTPPAPTTPLRRPHHRHRPPSRYPEICGAHTGRALIRTSAKPSAKSQTQGRKRGVEQGLGAVAGRPRAVMPRVDSDAKVRSKHWTEASPMFLLILGCAPPFMAIDESARPKATSGTLLWSAEGADASSSFAWAGDGVGDVNGDGYGDIVITDYPRGGYPGRFGAAGVFLGGSDGPSEIPDQVIGSLSGEFTHSGVEHGGLFLTNLVHPLGDVDGDGQDDVGLVEGDGGTRILRLYGGTGTGLDPLPLRTLRPDRRTYAFAGDATGGDFEGDGSRDLSVGDSSMDVGRISLAGITNVWPAAAEARFPRAIVEADDPVAYASFGEFLAAGDFDGDGADDLAVASPNEDSRSSSNTDQGRVSVFMGSASGLRAPSTWTAAGTSTRQYYGRGLISLGDLDGDGDDELAIGSHSDGDGRVDLHLGEAMGPGRFPALVLEGVEGAEVGYQLAACDVDGDGLKDLLSSQSTWDHFDVYTALNALPTTPTYTQTGWTEYFGGVVACAGDVNGDGREEVLVADRFDGDGTAYLFSF